MRKSKWVVHASEVLCVTLSLGRENRISRSKRTAVLRAILFHFRHQHQHTYRSPRVVDRREKEAGKMAFCRVIRSLVLLLLPPFFTVSRLPGCSLPQETGARCSGCLCCREDAGSRSPGSRRRQNQRTRSGVAPASLAGAAGDGGLRVAGGARRRGSL